MTKRKPKEQLIKPQVPEGTWEVLANVIAACKEAGSVSKLHKLHRGAEEAIRRHPEWKDICYQHMPFTSNRYTDEYLVEFGKQFQSIHEYRSKAPKEYQAAHKRGLVGEYKVEKTHKWTKEEIMQIASKYELLNDFYKNERKAMDAARTHGWYDEIKSMLKKQRHAKYTKEECMAEAKKYTTRLDFKNGSPGYYAATMQNGWKDEICAHMPMQYHGPKAATYEECKERALKYSKRGDFQKHEPRYYNRSREKGWIDEVCAHMKPSKRPSKKVWTKEECAAEALKCESRTEFRYKCQGGYGRAWTMGWLDEICSHMNELDDVTKRCIYAITFEDGHAYVGLTFNHELRWRDESSQEDEAVFRFIKKTGLQPTFKIIHDYTTEEEAQKLEAKYIQEYKDNGWVMINSMPAGSLGTRRAKYSIKKALELLHTCKTLAEYRKKYPGTYNRLVRHGYKEEIFKILPPKFKRYTDQELIDIAKDYSKRSELRKARGTITGLIRDRKLEPLAYAHMTDYQEELLRPKTKEEVAAIAAKYENKYVMLIHDAYAYKLAKKNGWDDVLEHLNKKRQSKGRWTVESARKVAPLCKDRQEFRLRFIEEYYTACRYKIIDELFPKDDTDVLIDEDVSKVM